MKKNWLIGAITLCVVSLPAIGDPVDPRLDYASNNLTFAAQQLVTAVRQALGDSHIQQDAETLYDAAEHFKEEVELGPVDLDVDFRTITETYNEMRNELSQSNVIQYDANARTCWFNTQEAFVALSRAWAAHVNPPPPQCDPVCTAITQMYQVGLGRNPDPGGLNGWINAWYNQGKNAVIAGIFSSPEYFTRHGSTYWGFVTGLYNDLLQRAPDAGGLNAWVGALNNGSIDLAHVALGIATSPEYLSHPRW